MSEDYTVWKVVVVLATTCAGAYAGLLRHKRLSIQKAPEKDRARLVEQALNWFPGLRKGIDPEKLGPDQRYDLVIRAIRTRFRTLLMFVVASLLALVALLTFGLLSQKGYSCSPTMMDAVRQRLVLLENYGVHARTVYDLYTDTGTKLAGNEEARVQLDTAIVRCSRSWKAISTTEESFRTLFAQEQVPPELARTYDAYAKELLDNTHQQLIYSKEQGVNGLRWSLFELITCEQKGGDCGAKAEAFASRLRAWADRMEMQLENLKEARKRFSADYQRICS